MASAFFFKFDPIEYAKQLRKAGVSQEQAEVQAQTMERVITDVLENQDLATKRDLNDLKNEIKNEINKLENKLEYNTKTMISELKVDLIKWILGTGVAAILALYGILKYVH